MSGMEIMLKAMGFDSDKMQEQLKSAGEEYKRVVKHFDDRLNTVETMIREIHECICKTENTNVVSIEKGTGTDG